MKKTVLLFALFLFATQINAQKSWSYGIELFPNSTFEIITNNGNGDSEWEQILNEKEIGKFCLSGQVYASYSINSRMSVSVGIGYQNTGNKTKKESPIWITNDTTFDPAIPKTVQYYYNHHNIQIPVFYSYNITSKLYARGGISTLFNFYNTSTFIGEDFFGGNSRYTVTDKSEPRFRVLNFSGNMGIGYTFLEMSSYSLYAQANVETTLLQLKVNAPLNRRPVSTGLILGIRF